MFNNQTSSGIFSNSSMPTVSRSAQNAFSENLPSKIYDLPNFKPSKKILECLVTFPDGREDVFIIDSASLGHHLFNAVLERLQLNERQYFGITFKDKEKNKNWLNYSVKISKQVPDKRMIFEFQVKFYPPEIEMIKEGNTIIYLAQQVRQDICSGKLLCSYYTYLSLASLIIQAEIGDFNEAIHKRIDYIKPHPVAPSKIQNPEFMEELIELHKLQKGTSPVEAYRKFLSNSSKLALYGMALHSMKNGHAEEIFLGINNIGIFVYSGAIRKEKHLWHKIFEFKYKENKLKLIVKGNAEKEPNRKLKFKCSSVKIAEVAFKSIVDHHFFFRISSFATQYKEYKEQKFREMEYEMKKIETFYSSTCANVISCMPEKHVNIERKNKTPLKNLEKLNENGKKDLLKNFPEFDRTAAKCTKSSNNVNLGSNFLPNINDYQIDNKRNSMRNLNRSSIKPVTFFVPNSQADDNATGLSKKQENCSVLNSRKSFTKNQDQNKRSFLNLTGKTTNSFIKISKNLHENESTENRSTKPVKQSTDKTNQLKRNVEKNRAKTSIKSFERSREIFGLQ